MIPGATYDKENRSEPVAAKYYAKSKARLSYTTDFLLDNTTADTRTRYPLIQDDYKVDLLVSSGTHAIVKNKSFKSNNVVIISPVQMVMKEAVKKPEARRYLKETVRRELNNSLPSRIFIFDQTLIHEDLPRAELVDLLATMKLGSEINQASGMILNPTSLQFNVTATGLQDKSNLRRDLQVQGCVVLLQFKGKYLQQALLNSREIWTWFGDGTSPFQAMGNLGCNRDSYIKNLAYMPIITNMSSPTFNGVVNCTNLDKIYLTADTSVAPTVYSGNLYALFYFFGKPDGSFITITLGLTGQLNYTCQ